MEPIEAPLSMIEVITHYTEVEHVLEPSKEWPNSTGYKFKDIPAWLHVQQNHAHLKPGDRVRITIQKEVEHVTDSK